MKNDRRVYLRNLWEGRWAPVRVALSAVYVILRSAQRL
jgi:hypothetical protein